MRVSCFPAVIGRKTEGVMLTETCYAMEITHLSAVIWSGCQEKLRINQEKTPEGLLGSELEETSLKRQCTYSSFN